MVTHALLVVLAATYRTSQPPPAELIGLTATRLSTCSRRCLPVPPAISTIGCAGRCGDAAIKPAPVPVTTNDKPPNHEDHDLRLEY
jgi:hypothetical protein